MHACALFEVGVSWPVLAAVAGIMIYRAVFCGSDALQGKDHTHLHPPCQGCPQLCVVQGLLMLCKLWVGEGCYGVACEWCSKHSACSLPCMQHLDACVHAHFLAQNSTVFYK
jgi:hypothetical protein